MHTRTEVSAQSYCVRSCLWTVSTRPPLPDLPQFDHVYFATGTQIDADDVGCLQTMNQKYPVETYGGLPALTDDLKWREDIPLFVTGKLAMLQIGPGAANLEGARLSAERVAWAIDEMLDSSEAGSREHMTSEDRSHRYAAGIGSRYDQLEEE